MIEEHENSYIDMISQMEDDYENKKQRGLCFSAVLFRITNQSLYEEVRIARDGWGYELILDRERSINAEIIHDDIPFVTEMLPIKKSKLIRNDDSFALWNPSMSDILADDWYFISM